MKQLDKKFYVYILRCADNTLYTGYTDDVAARLKTHNGESTTPGAKYTRSRRPVVLMYTEVCATKSAAMSREAQIKKLSRKQKEALISQ